MSVSFSTLLQKGRPSPMTVTSAAMRDAISRVPPTHITHLNNKVKIACEENPFSKFATIGLWLDVGTKHENRETTGLMQTLMRAGFHGTTNMDRAQLTKSVEEIGGHLMADVGREHSYVAVKCTKENVSRAVGLLADVVRNARLSDADLVAAKKELNTHRHLMEERVDDLVDDFLHIAAYDATDNGGLGLPLLGLEDTTNANSAQTLQDFRQKHFTGPRMGLVGTGNVKFDQLESLGQQFLGDLSPESNKPLINSRYVGGDYRLWNLRLKMCHLSWAVETPAATSGDMVALELATHIHGKFHRSQHELGQHQLHRIIKTFSSLDHGTPTNTPFPEKSPETLQSFIKHYEDTGLVGMNFVSRQARTFPDVAGAIHDQLQMQMIEWCRLAQKVTHDRELDQAKINMKAQLMFNCDGSTNSMKEIGRHMFHYGRRVTLEDYFARIDDITPTNVMECLQHYYYGRRPVLAMTGYFHPLPNYDAIVHWMYKYWY